MSPRDRDSDAVLRHVADIDIAEQARRLGQLRRALEAEGFESEDVSELCAIWLSANVCDMPPLTNGFDDF